MNKKNLYLTIYNLLKQNKTPSQISKELDLPKQNVQYYLTKLKKQGKIKKKGYGTWEVKNLTSNTLQKNHHKIRGHAFIWKVKLKEEITDWEKRIQTKKLDYKLVRGIIPRIFINRKKVWLNKKTLTIYEPESFYGGNAIESRKYAVISLIETLQAIENKLGVSLTTNNFSVSREHYALIKNDLAKQVNRNGEKLHIRDEHGEWMWVDMSDGIGELETGNRNALVNNVGVQGWWNDMKDSKFKVTPSFITNSFNQVLKIQQMHSQNIIKHQRVLDEMLVTLNAIRKSLSQKS